MTESLNGVRVYFNGLDGFFLMNGRQIETPKEINESLPSLELDLLVVYGSWLFQSNQDIEQVQINLRMP